MAIFLRKFSPYLRIKLRPVNLKTFCNTLIKELLTALFRSRLDVNWLELDRFSQIFTVFIND